MHERGIRWDFFYSPPTLPLAVFLFHIKMSYFIILPCRETLESCGIRGFLWNSPNFVLGDLRITIKVPISESPFVCWGSLG